MRDTVYLFLFDGYADWEPALACCEIREHRGFKLTTVSFDDGTVTSMGGLSVIPEIRLDQVQPERAVMLIVPGGKRWEDSPDPEQDKRLVQTLQALRATHVPVAAICGATLLLARNGMLRGARHTSNGLEYLQDFAPEYKEGHLYVHAPAVRHRGIITASGSGYVEFAREILSMLRIYDEHAVEVWYALFKNGVVAGLP